MSTLTAKQQAFAQEYLIDLNASAAYRRAGYAPKNADADAAKLMVNPGIQAAINAGMAERQHQTGITKARVVEMTLDGIEAAREAGNPNAFLRGVELLARLHGYIIERRDVRTIRSFDDLTDGELAALEADALAAERSGRR